MIMISSNVGDGRSPTDWLFQNARKIKTALKILLGTTSLEKDARKSFLHAELTAGFAAASDYHSLGCAGDHLRDSKLSYALRASSAHGLAWSERGRNESTPALADLDVSIP